MTIGELKERLQGWPDDYQIIFGCEELAFYRLKQRGERLVQLEFGPTIYKDGDQWYVHDG
jgi:hypothetical protein